MRKRILFSLLCLMFGLAPAFASAASFEVSGWLPYWRVASSTLDVLPHLSDLTEINPFVYTLRNDGTFLDNGHMDQEPWTSVLAAARARKVRIVPTIMTSDGDLIHTLLSNSTSRIALEERMAAFVKANNFDGIEIDFEGKKAEDKNYFSPFLKGLYARMGSKLVECDIEARTPASSRYYGAAIPPDAEIYANDFTAINKYCDRVKLMTYDQQGVDQLLASTAASSSTLYAPVADPAWVEKVVALTSKSIKLSKIEIGIPTYGYEYDVTAYANDQYLYDILWTFNPGYATQIEQQFGVAPTRAPWGEMELTYINSSKGSSTPPLSMSPYAGLAAAAAASTYATNSNGHLDFRMLVWPDAQAIAGKIALAKALGVRGVAIFKLDGGEDPGIWSVLQGVARPASAMTAVSSGRVVSGQTFARGLGLGSAGADVRTLQQILNKDTSTQVAASGTGSPGHESTLFGAATDAAVKKFQLKFKIAAPGNAGYGYVGPATRAKLNTLL